MKKIYSVLLTVLLLCAVNSKAQVNLYTFSSSTGTYTEISGGTVLGTTANDEQVFNNSVAGAAGPVTAAGFPIGFSFNYNGVSYDRFAVATNGYIVLGSSAGAGTFAIANNTGTAISAATAGLNNLISVFNQDLQGQAGSELSYQLSGTAPSRTLTVQWKGYKRWNLTDPMNFNFQIILQETSNRVFLSYGTVTTVTTTAAQIGLKGTSNADFFSRTTATDWTATTASATNAGTVTLSTTVFPPSGLLYRFTPPPPCVTPTSLAVSVTGVPAPTSIAGSFTEAGGTLPSGYVVIRTTTNVQPVPVNGTTYTVGNNAVGYIEYVGTTFGGWSSTSLTPSTTYYYWVFSFNGLTCGGGPLYSAAATNTSVTTTAAGNVVSTTTGGLWSQTSTWSSGVVPVASDNVTIANGATVTIDVAAVAYSVTVGQGASGVLTYDATTASSLTTGGNVTVSAGAAFNTASSGTVTTHSLSVAGNITNNGIIDFAIGTAGTGLVFTGAANSSFTGTGATTDLYTLLLSKSARANEVELSLSNFSVRDLNTAATGALLTSATGTGTLKISGTNTFSGTLWSAVGYSIPATLGFWLNNPNFTVTALTGSPTVAGLFRVSQGIYNIGTATGNSMGFSTGSVITVEGGAINAAGRFGVAASANVFTYTQTGGIITVGIVGNASTTLGSFDLGTAATSTVTISGGTIIVPLASTSASGPRDYRNQAGLGIAGVTGGTLQIGTATTPAASTFTIAGVVPNLVINNASGGHTVNFGTIATYNHITLDITIGAGCTLNPGNNVFLFNGNTITNNGTLTHNGVSSRFITFKPNTNMTYTGTGVVTAPLTSLELQNDLNFTFNSSVSNVVAARVIIFSGSFVNANKLTLGNGGTSVVNVQIGNTTTPTAGGTFDVAPLFNLGSGGQNISYLRTTNPKTTGPEVNTARALNNLTVDDNVNALTVAGGPLSVAGTLTLTTGVVNTTSANLLTLGTATAAGTLAGASALSYVNGPFARTFAASRTAVGTYAIATLLPVGKGGNYLPVYIDPTTTADGPVVFGAEVFTTNSGTPGAGVTTLSATRWETPVISGAANFTSANIRVVDPAIASTDQILQATSAAGSYEGLSVGSTFSSAPNFLTTNAAVTAAAYTGFLAYGNFVPACAIPSAVAVGTITTTSAEVTFTCVSCTGTYIVEYGAPGFTPGTGATAGTGGTVVTGTASPIALSPLAIGAVYQVYVRQNCGSGTFSANSAVVNFATLVSNDDCGSATPIPCNGSVSGNSTGATNDVLSATTCGSTTTTVGINRAVWFTVSPANSGSMTISTCTATLYDTYLRVYTGSCGTFTCVGADDDACAETTYGLSSYTFTAVGGTTYYIMMGGYGTADFGAYTISATCPALCAAPAAATISAITSGGATATWAGTGTFILEYGVTGFTPGTGATAGAGGTVINPAVSPQAITGLNPATGYQVYVRQDCSGSGNGYSPNSTVVAFTTQALPPANDNCGGATTIGTAPLSTTSAGATQSQGGVLCAGFTSPISYDVWFQFTALSAGTATINLTNATATDFIIEGFSGACGSLTSLGCADATIGGNETLVLNGLTSGATYFIRVYGYNGASGTFTISATGAALPVAIEYLRGTKQNNRNVLDWKVACYNSPTVTLSLERSSDGRNFTGISTTTETAVRCLQPFSYNDLAPLAGINYYRLKSIDIDGKVSYSTVVALLNQSKGFEIVGLAPNPVMDEAILSVTSAEKTIMEIVVSDLSGKQISKQRLSLIAGNNQVSLNFRNVAAGTYQVTGLTADGQIKSLRFVKQ